jgi:hypothetical protein
LEEVLHFIWKTSLFENSYYEDKNLNLNLNLKPRAGLQVSALWLRFIRVSTSSGDATKQGKSPPGNGVQAQIAATEGISACRNAVEDATAGDAAGGLDV